MTIPLEKRFLPAVAALLGCFCLALPAKAVNDVAGAMFTLTTSSSAPNGAWCWYQDDRAIIDDSDPNNTRLLLSSISAGSSPENGDVDLLWRNLDTGAQGEFELANQFQQDDHDSAGLYLRPDGRYLAMYSRHGSDVYTRWRVSTNPHDPTSWGPEVTLTNAAGATYNNIYYLPNDNGGAGRMYNFTRSVNYDPNVQVSNDNGTSWSYAGKLLTEGGSSDRPYVRYASDGKKIHFITTDRHPRNFQNSIYHGYVQDGVLYNSDGTVVDGSVFDAAGVAPNQLSTVFQNGSQFDGLSLYRAWTISIEIDNTGNPVGIISARVNDSDQDHRFLYARHDGVQWHVNQLAAAGGYLYAAENDYTGLASIDPDNPNVVYMSSDIDPRTSTGTAKYELYKGLTADFGDTWTWTPITQNSTIDNLRPVVPDWNGKQTALTWMRGTYSTYTSWDTEVVGINFTATDPKSLLWQGGGASPTVWDINGNANWDSGGGAADVYLNGAEVAFDDTAATFNVNLAATVTPSNVAFNNSAHAYTLTGAGIGGTGRLRVIGGGTVTLTNGANNYSGDTLIARGTLALSGPATISASPLITVMADGNFNVTAVAGGAYTLNGQTLAIDGTVSGNILATNSSTVHVNSTNSLNGNLTAQSGTLVDGAGHVAGNVSIQSGATLRVGNAGLTSYVQQYSFLNATHGAGGNTTEADGSVFTPTTNPDWQIRELGNGGTVYQGGSNMANPNEAAVLKTTITGLTPGGRYDLYVNYWTATGSAWRILAGTAANDLTLFDANYTAVAGATDGIDLNTLSYTSTPMITESNRTMWGGALGELIADASGRITVFVDDTGTVDGDDRTWYDGLTYGAIVYEAQSMMVGGDLALSSGATVDLDIYDPTVSDLVSIGGHFAAAGTLLVVLDPDAPVLQLGDTFDLFDFGAASGAFDGYNLPSLSTGLAWNVSNLTTTGELTVVVDVDLDGDGWVSGPDFLLIQRTNPALIPLWQAQYGLQVVHGTGLAAATTVVPEPNALAASVLAILLVNGRSSLKQKVSW